MSFSFETPVSALSKHQQRVDMISKNIANLNTSGFKGDRMNFLERLGTVDGSKQFQFEQGSINSTGRATDMAIKGESFFVLENQKGEESFSRLGSFNLDKKGELVNSEGMNVQGWQVDQNTGKMAETRSDIVIDENMSMEAAETENVWLTGNLSSKMESTRQRLTTNTNLDSNTGLENMTTEVDFSDAHVVDDTNDEFRVRIGKNIGSGDANILADEKINLTHDRYNTASDFAEEINSKINSKGDLYGKVEATVIDKDDGSQQLQLRVQDVDDGTQLQIDETQDAGIFALGDIPGGGLSSGANSEYKSVSDGTQINNLLEVTENFESGDSINISGNLPDGTTINENFVYGEDGNTVRDLITRINSAYQDEDGNQLARAKLTDDNKIEMVDTSIGETQTSINLSTEETGGNIDVPTFVTTAEGNEASVNSSSVVYDSTGNSHNISLKFTKPKDTTQNFGKWNWKAELTGSEKVIGGDSGTVEFDRDGNLVSFNYGGGEDGLTFDPNNGSSKMTVNLRAEGTDDYKGLSQYNTVSSVKVREQDGNAAGNLNGFRVDEEGSIIGSFTNGEESKLAQVAVAEFTNPDGLEQAGGSNYKATENSGEANIGKAPSQRSQIMSKSLESSTVELSDQFSKMIESQNSFDAASKVIRTFNEIMDRTINLKR